jgi:ribosomal protein L7Ae-like RNA K-turn-binding protein
VARQRAEPAGADRAQRVLQLVGLARRAGYVAVGTRAVREAASRGEICVAVVARDATDNARKRLHSLSDRSDIEVIEFGTRGSLGRAVGREEAVVVGIGDRGLGRRIVGEARRHDVQAGSSPEDEATGAAD